MLSTCPNITNQLTWSDLLDHPELEELQKRILTVLRSAYSGVISVLPMKFYGNVDSYVQDLLEDFRLKISRGATKEIIEELFVWRSGVHPNTWVKNPVLVPVQGSSADFAIGDTLIYCGDGQKSSFMKYLLVRFLSGDNHSNDYYRRFLEFSYSSKTISIHTLSDNSEFEKAIPLLRDYYDKIYASKFPAKTELEALVQSSSIAETSKTEEIHDSNNPNDLVHRIQRIYLNQVHLRESIAKSRAALATQEILFKTQEGEIEAFWNQGQTIQAQLDKVSALEESQTRHSMLIQKVRELIESKSNGPQFAVCLTQLEELVKSE